MTHESANSSGLAPGVSSFRERLTEQLSGPGRESNWSLVVAGAVAIERHERRQCDACDGLGFVALSEAKLAEFAARIKDMQGEQRSAHAAGKLDRERQIGENIRGEHWKLNRDSICKECRGSGYRTPVGGEPGLRHDSTFTTVACPTCTGHDSRNARRDGKGGPKYPGLMDLHTGTSCGSVLFVADDGNVHVAPCADCMDELGRGRGYRVPITARPMGKGEDPGAYVEELEDVPVYYRARQKGHEPLDALEAMTDEDPLLAAAVAALMSPAAADWNQHPWGRRFALWPLVDAGQRLGDESVVEGASDDWYRRKLEVLQAERLAVEAGTAKDRQRALCAMADRQARKLEFRAEIALRKAEAA